MDFRLWKESRHGEKKIYFISIIILFTIQTSACSAEGQESQGIWHNEYESEIEISSTEEERKDVSENKNITFRVLDGKEISVSRDRLRDTERINNRWSLEETDAMIAPLKGTWTTDTYMGYALPYNLRKFEPDTYADEEARETFSGNITRRFEQQRRVLYRISALKYNRWKNMKMDTQSVSMAMKARFLSFKHRKNK